MEDESTESDRSKPAPGLLALFRYPIGVYFCLGNEFAERFSFYGMRAVLTFYLITHHQFDDSTAKLIYHTFVCIAYFTPLLGSILADEFFGRYKVILYVSILYCVGQVLLTIGSLSIYDLMTFLHVIDFVGLLTIAVATGGIKPCVSAFAADQFPTNMVEERKQFFSFFYFSINSGALLSQFITPVLRGRVSCFGESTCFPLAFGVPSIFMFVALAVFVIGTPFYKKDKNRDPTILNSIRCITYAVRRRLCGASNSRLRPDHWLDYSVPIYGKPLVEDVKRILSILILFLPVVVFWALFDQQGSTWVIQANQMNGRIGRLTVLPDQVSLLNPLLIITLIPLFEVLVYPFLTSHGLLTRSLQRMALGGFLAALSFLSAALVQFQINGTMVVAPAENTIRMTVVNPYQLCIFSVGNKQFIGRESTEDIHLNLFPANPLSYLTCNKSGGAHSTVRVDFPNFNSSNFLAKPGMGLVAVTKLEGTIDLVPYPLKKTAEGNSTELVLLSSEKLAKYTNRTLLVKTIEGKFLDQKSITNDSRVVSVRLQSPLLGSDLFNLYTVSCDNFSCDEDLLKTVKSETGAVALFVEDNGNDTAFAVELIPPNTVSIFWQFPQYFLMTTGEILFSVSGLEFSYSQASSSMKSVLQAIWLLTVACGNVIDMIISGSHLIRNAAVEFLVYSALMAVVISIFVLLARRYKYVDRDGDDPALTPDADKKDHLVPMAERKDYFLKDDVTKSPDSQRSLT